MNVEDALKWMGVLESLHDGTQRSADRIKRLHELLLTDPMAFEDEFWLSINENDPIRKQAEALIRSGTVSEKTTFAQLPSIAEKIKRDGDGQ